MPEGAITQHKEWQRYWEHTWKMSTTSLFSIWNLISRRHFTLQSFNASLSNIKLLQQQSNGLPSSFEQSEACFFEIQSRSQQLEAILAERGEMLTPMTTSQKNGLRALEDALLDNMYRYSNATATRLSSSPTSFYQRQRELEVLLTVYTAHRWLIIMTSFTFAMNEWFEAFALLSQEIVLRHSSASSTLPERVKTQEERLTKAANHITLWSHEQFLSSQGKQERMLRDLLAKLNAPLRARQAESSFDECLSIKFEELNRLSKLKPSNSTLQGDANAMTSSVLTMGIWECRLKLLPLVNEEVANQEAEGLLVWSFEKEHMVAYTSNDGVGAWRASSIDVIDRFHMYIPRNPQAQALDVPSSSLYRSGFLPSNQVLRLLGEQLESEVVYHRPFNRNNVVQQKDNDEEEKEEENNEEISSRGICQPGFFGSDCTICPPGSFCTGDGLRRLCANAPPEEAVYTEYGSMNANCKFACLAEDKYAHGNVCRKAPLGYYSPDGIVLSKCRLNILPDMFLEWMSGGASRDETSCNASIQYQALVIPPPQSLYSHLSLGPQFSLQMWIQWSSFGSLNATLNGNGIGVGMLEATDLWRWYIHFNKSTLRMVFESLKSDKWVARSKPFRVSQQWHHFGNIFLLFMREAVNSDSPFAAITAEERGRVISFYLDGKSIGNDWFDGSGLQTDQPATMLAVGGKRYAEALPEQGSPASFRWLVGSVDELYVHSSRRLTLPWLGWFSPIRYHKVFCSGLSHELSADNRCVSRCPAGTHSVSSSYSNEQANEEHQLHCQCDKEGEEWWQEGGMCLPTCPRSSHRTNTGECLCPIGTFMGWGFDTVRYVTFNFTRQMQQKWNVQSITLLHVGDNNEKGSHEISAVSECYQPSSASPSWIECSSSSFFSLSQEMMWRSSASGGSTNESQWSMVRLRLLAPLMEQRIERIVIKLLNTPTTVATEDSVHVFLSSDDTELGEEIAPQTTLWQSEYEGAPPQPTLVLKDRRLTWPFSKSLSCIACPSHSTLSSFPRTRLQDCRCHDGYVLHEEESRCVLGKASIGSVALYPPPGVHPVNTAINFRVLLSKNDPLLSELEKGYFEATIAFESEERPKVLRLHPSLSPPINLHTNATITVTLRQDGHLPSPPVIGEYSLYPRLPTPQFYPRPSSSFSSVSPSIPVYIFLPHLTNAGENNEEASEEHSPSIRITLDNSPVTSSSRLYNGEVMTITRTTIFRAKAFPPLINSTSSIVFESEEARAEYRLLSQEEEGQADQEEDSFCEANLAVCIVLPFALLFCVGSAIFCGVSLYLFMKKKQKKQEEKEKKEKSKNVPCWRLYGWRDLRYLFCGKWRENRELRRQTRAQSIRLTAVTPQETFVHDQL
ncbi:hypothetical protein QOT17_025303 [Balamuthia mandrillaris]